MISFMNCVDVLVEVLREWSASSCKVCAVALHILMFEAQRPKLKEQIIRSDNFTSILECVSTNIKEGKVCTPFCVMIECLVENSPEIRDAFNKDGRVVSLINNIYLKNPASDTFLDVIEASLQCLGKSKQTAPTRSYHLL